MSDFKNPLDKAFRDKLGDYRVDPPEEIWTAISSKTGKNRERKLVFIAWRVAAGIAIIITAGFIYYYVNHTEKQTITQNPENQPEIISKPVTINKPALSEKTAIPENKSSTGIPVESRTADSYKSGKNSEQEEFALVSQQDKVAEKLAVPKVPEIGQFEQAKKPEVYLSDIPYLLKPADFRQDRIPERKFPAVKSIMNLNTPMEFVEETSGEKNIWSITAQLSPTYNYRNLSQGNANAIASLNETESGKFSYGGGLQLGLKATERISFFTGLMYSRIGFGIRNVLTQQADIEQSSGDILINQERKLSNFYQVSNSTGAISSASWMSKAMGVTANYTFFGNQNTQANLIDQAGYVSSSDKFDQYFQFIELPFILRYRLLNRKLKLNLLGGLSTNVLIGNRVYLVTGEEKSEIGTTNGIRHINYSGNLGFGFDYDLGRNFLLILEPQFKYYLNSINENVLLESRPYSVGMFTGIRYIF